MSNYEYIKKKIITINLENRYFEITRNQGAYEAECNDYDTFDFHCKFTDKEREEIYNLYEKGYFDEWLEY